MTQAKIVSAEVAGEPDVELFEPMEGGHVPANVILPLRILGRVIPVMFQPDPDDMQVARGSDGYLGDENAWSWEMLHEEFVEGQDSELRLGAARAAAAKAYQAALEDAGYVAG